MAQIHGWVAPGFEAVRETFQANFAQRGEVGAAFVVRRHGEVVVDLWGGMADPEAGRPWEQDTAGVVFSATKGLMAIALLMLTDQGQLDLDAPIASFWPGFAAHGKQAITTRMLLNHRAGLSVLDAPLELDVFPAPEKGRNAPTVHAIAAMENQVPHWTPDTDQGYGACAFGAFTGEIVRRLTGRTAGTWFADEIARPLGLHAWIGLPAEERKRVARLLPVSREERVRFQVPSALARRTHEGRLFRRVIAGKRSLSGRALLNPTLGPRQFEALNDPEVLAHELPWMNAVCTADSLSRAYAALLGEIDGVRLVRPEALRPVRLRQSWSQRDRVLQKPLGFSQGFVKDELTLFSPTPAAFGHPGAGGALGWADPDAGLTFGYVMNRMDWRIRSPRAVGLCRAVYACL